MKRRSHQVLATVIVTGIVASGALSVWAALAYRHRASLLGAASDGGGFHFLFGHPTLAEVQSADHQVQLSVGLHAVVELVTGVLFVIWMFRLYSDVHRAKPGLPQFGSGWAIGGWFVPFLNLVRPYQVVSDTWRLAGAPEERDSSGTRVVTLWWTAYLLPSVVGLVAFLQGTSTLAEFHHHDEGYAITYSLQVISAVMAILMVRALTARVAAMPIPEPLPVGQYGMRFNPAPGWPVPPAGWTPPPGWQPDATWPAAPPNWRFWIP